MTGTTRPTASELLMLHGVSAVCADCGDERVFVPVDDQGQGTGHGPASYCCTGCDAAVFLLLLSDPVPAPGTTRLAG